MSKTLWFLLERTWNTPKYCIGRIFFFYEENGKETQPERLCDSCEDTVRNLPEKCPYTVKGKSCLCKEKRYGVTAIPAGIYDITMEYSAKFKRKLPYLHDVPHFLGILIHAGNTAADSAGCILPGLNKEVGKVLTSRVYEDKIKAMIEVNGGKAKIKIVDKFKQPYS